MKVTKEQRVYLGLLGVGLVALTLDRLIFSPASAEAASDPSAFVVTQSPKTALPAASGASTPMAAASTVSNPVAQKLNALSESMQLANVPANASLKDAFSPAPSWAGKPAAAPTDLKSFEQTHQLTGVMFSGRHGQAMINGKLLSVGQAIDGFTLVSVAQGAATFQSAGVTVTLRSR